MDLARNVEGFFHEEVDRAFRDEGLSPGTMVEHYIVKLLASYAAHRIEETPLALRMLAANEAPLPERRRQLRDIGDTSLYLSGFWSEHLAGGPVDVDYYIGMGGSAYGELARGGAGWTGDPFSDVFSELAANFVRFVGALALVSRRMAVPASNQDVVRLYRLLAGDQEPVGGGAGGAMGVVIGRGGGRPAVTRRAGARGRSRCWRACSSGWRRFIASRRAWRSTHSSSARRRARRLAWRARRASSCWSSRTAASSGSAFSSTRRRWRISSGTIPRRTGSPSGTSATSAWPSRG